MANDKDMWQDIANMVKLCVWYNVECLSVSQGTLSFSGRTLPHGVKQPVSQSVSWLPIIRYFVAFPSIYWRTLFLVHTQAHNTHHAFLHNAKFFFKSLYYSSGTVNGRSCTISVSVTKGLTRTWHSSRLWISVSERKHIEHTYVIKHVTLCAVTHTHILLSGTVKNGTIKCE